MVLQQVTSLYELSLQVLSDKICKFMDEHCGPCEFCSVCRTEQCSVIKPVIQMLDLPEIIIQRVYNKMYLEYKSIFDSNTNLLHLFLTLLRFEHTFLKIENYCFKRYEKDIPFMIKFGKKINSLKINDEAELSITIGKRTAAMMRGILLLSAVNIQVLDLEDIKVTAKLLQVVGVECTQLKVLSGITIGGRITSRSFRMLLFCTTEYGTWRNKCCDTLQTVNIDTEDDYFPSEVVKMNKVISLLLRNITHLKSVGIEFDFGNYFQAFKPGEIHQARLENLNIYYLSKHKSIILKDFCPTVKKLRIDSMESGVPQELNSFMCLEEIYIEETEVVIYQEIVGEHWANLKILNVCSSGSDNYINLDVDVVIKNFPVLTELEANIANVSWSEATKFNCLKKVIFNLLTQPNVSWFASFASTVQSIQLGSNNWYPVISSDDCKVLLTVPFPNLEHLRIQTISYNFEFYSSVLAKLPKLEKCFMYCSTEIQTLKVQMMTELSQFMRVNNLQCELQPSHYSF